MNKNTNSSGNEITDDIKNKYFSLLNQKKNNLAAPKKSNNFNSRNYISEDLCRRLPTFESVTSSEFRHGINIDNHESGFITNAQEEQDVIQIKNITIKND